MANLHNAHTSFSFYLLPGFSLQAFSCAVEVLRLANEAIGKNVYSWQVVSEDGQPVMSSCRMTVGVDSALRNERERTHKSNLMSAAVICGGSAIPRPNRQLDAWLRECRMRRIPLVCIGSGTVVVARAGLADGRRCAVHWEQLPLFCEQFPGIESTQTAFEHDADLHTCSGGDAPFDMFLHLVERDHGSVVVNRVCEKAIAYRMRSAGERQRLPLHSRVKLNHKAVMKVIGLMEASLDEPMPVDDLVALSGISRRQIERLFDRELGRSPNRYYMELRLERAQLLLVSTNLPVVEVAVACGFISPSHFSKVYREAYGCPPHQTRLAARANGHADLMDPTLLGLERSGASHQSLPMTA
ncbi:MULTISPECIES: GlxA family transcriptional regulator [unclassified Mesorhizobium]|uniref:GlxA family transcriptional regulator n=1 Tax=unclassified Mesorhizobium TaxID=325217 RepID=UPI00112E6048|nr:MULTISPECIES: GlxA family transcriptional regulator [unclassified Mesorhizobium]MBZ9800070.1 GlxA family transcriptional regulator [Mesorhizobium sp. ES1-4]TPJ33505.1 GlxA family transcriptional regulator [Mesorhizobium sp. B2-6-5]